MSITRTLAASLAIVALGVPGAQAQPPDMHASTAIAAAQARHKQDLRSADARDAALNPRDAREPAKPQKVDLRSADARDAALNPRPSGATAHTQVISTPAKAAPVNTGSGVDWAAIAIGAGLSLTATTGLAALNGRRVRRLQRTRVTG